MLVANPSAIASSSHPHGSSHPIAQAQAAAGQSPPWAFPAVPLRGGLGVRPAAAGHHTSAPPAVEQVSFRPLPGPGKAIQANAVDSRFQGRIHVQPNVSGRRCSWLGVPVRRAGGEPRVGQVLLRQATKLLRQEKRGGLRAGLVQCVATGMRRGARPFFPAGTQSDVTMPPSFAAGFRRHIPTVGIPAAHHARAVPTGEPEPCAPEAWFRTGSTGSRPHRCFHAQLNVRHARRSRQGVAGRRTVRAAHGDRAAGHPGRPFDAAAHEP